MQRMSTVVCQKCGHQNDDTDKFCGGCAAPLSDEGPADTSGDDEPIHIPGTPKPSSNPKPAIGLIIAFAIIPIVLFMVLGPGGSCSGSAEGVITSTGEPHGDYTLRPTSCYSGEHEDFFGVWVAPELESAGGGSGWRGGLKLVKNHMNQWEIYVESPVECQNNFDCVIRPLDTSTCSKVEVDVHNTNTMVNNITVREGHVNLECDTPEGGTYHASLTFEGCS
jgi:hypothetical protein